MNHRLHRLTRILIMAILMTTGTAQALWISPTSYNDPNSKWSNEARAYDLSLSLYASLSGAAGTQNESYLELLHAGITDCNKVRFYMGIGADPDAVIDVNYGDAWNNIYTGWVTAGWNTFEIGSSETVVGVRIKRPYPTTSTGFNVYEVFFWQPSTAPPTKVTLSSPADEAADMNNKVILSWAIASLTDTDSYNVYLGTDNPPSSIVNGDNQAITNTPTAETYDPEGLPPYDTYYWRIDAVNDNNVNASDVYSFTRAQNYKVLFD